MDIRMKTLAVVCAATTGIGACAPEDVDTRAAVQPSPGADSTQTGPRLPAVLARVGGTEITLAEISATLGPLPAQPTHQQYEKVEKAVDKAINQRLVELRAADRGLTAAALLELEVEAGLESPDDEQVRDYWETYQDHLDDWDETTAAQIRNYLIQQQRLRRHAELMQELKSAYSTEMLLGPFRAHR